MSRLAIAAVMPACCARTARLYLGDARQRLQEMPEKSAHVSIYSPPYWQLRSYLGVDVPGKDLELGQEERVEDYIEHQLDVASAVRRVLRDDGTLWIVIGDKLVDDRKWGGATGGKATAGLRGSPLGVNRSKINTGLKEGNLAGIPYRLALALQADGWFWRSIVVWEKLTCMPSSQFGWHWAPHRVKVRTSERAAAGTKHADAHYKPQGSRNGRSFTGRADWTSCPGCKVCSPSGGLVLRRGKWRPTTSHETVLMFSKSAEYYGDGEGVREPDGGTDHPRRVLTLQEPSGGLLAPQSGIRTSTGRNGAGRNLRSVWREASAGDKADLLDFLAARFGEREMAAALCEFAMSDGSLSDVWTLGPEPLAAAHHAAFPSEIPRRIITASTPNAGCCPACGAPYARVVTREFHPQEDVSASRSVRGSGVTKGMDASNRWQGVPRGTTATATSGWRPTCGCVEVGGPVPCVVLDPFMGSGRTGVAALEMGRSFVGIEPLSRLHGDDREPGHRHGAGAGRDRRGEGDVGAGGRRCSAGAVPMKSIADGMRRKLSVRALIYVMGEDQPRSLVVMRTTAKIELATRDGERHTYIRKTLDGVEPAVFRLRP